MVEMNYNMNVETPSARAISPSLGTSPSEVLTPCHFGPHVEKMVIKEPILPSECVIPGVLPSIGFKTHPNYLKEQATATDFVYDPTLRIENGQPYAYLRTGSSDAIRFHASGLIDNSYVSPVYPPIGEYIEIQRWRDVTEGDRAVSYITQKKEGFLIEGPERLYDFGPDTPLKKFVVPVNYSGPNNLFGKYISLNDNRRQDIRNILFNSTHRTLYDTDTADFIDFLTEKYGPTARTITGIGSEKLPESKVARLYFDNKNSYLIGSTDFYEKAKAMAESYGLYGRKAIEFVKRAIIYHELVHNFQGRMAEEEAERDVGETLYEFFLRKASDLEGTEEGRIYRVLAAAEKAYAKYWGKVGKRIAKSSSNSRNLESLMKELEAEASRLGLKGEAAQDYVIRGLKEAEYSEESDLEKEIDREDKKYEEIDNEDYNNRETTEDIEGSNESDAEGAADSGPDSAD